MTMYLALNAIKKSLKVAKIIFTIYYIIWHLEYIVCVIKLVYTGKYVLYVYINTNNTQKSFS